MQIFDSNTYYINGVVEVDYWGILTFLESSSGLYDVNMRGFGYYCS